MNTSSSSNCSPLIPRATLFGNAERDAPRISPDGRHLLWLAPYQGIQSVWLQTVGETESRVVAHDPVRPIAWAGWPGNGREVLYLQDHGGDENYHLFRVDLVGGMPQDLTPGENLRAVPRGIDARFPNELLVALNARDQRQFDVHRVNLTTGGVTLDTMNPGDTMVWLADNRLVVRAAVAILPDGSYAIRVRDDGRAPWRLLEECSAADGAPRLVAFSADDHALYAITAHDANASRLVCYDIATADRTVIFEDAEYDVDRAFVDPATREVVAVAVLRERLEWTALTPSFADQLGGLAKACRGDFTIESTTADGTALIVRDQRDNTPDHFYAYDRSSHQATLLFCDRPALLAHELAPMQPIAFPARDGLSIRGYLTRPVGVPPSLLPMVLYVHGGPWIRDRWGYDPVVQWLANRGYAVLQVNFRGSSGYGKAFLNAGNRQWAGAMRTDLLDAREWAVSSGYADPARVGIFGASYGGYAVLTALAWTPEAFACGVDVVGPSDLTTFMASIPPYWEPMRQVLSERVGDDPKFLRSHSPLHKASCIRSPLLIVQGANDPRVKQQESDQMVEALRAQGTPVLYQVFPDEGHGLADPRNLGRFTALAEAFLARNLGGRLEPDRADAERSTYLR